MVAKDAILDSEILNSYEESRRAFNTQRQYVARNVFPGLRPQSPKGLPEIIVPLESHHFRSPVFYLIFIIISSRVIH